jgi:hypothetical protein
MPTSVHSRIVDPTNATPWLIRKTASLLPSVLASRRPSSGVRISEHVSWNLGGSSNHTPSLPIGRSGSSVDAKICE